MNEIVIILGLGIFFSGMMYLQSIRSEKKQFYKAIETEGEIYMQRLAEEREKRTQTMV